MKPKGDCYDKPIWTVRQLLREVPGLPAELARVAPTALGRGLSNSFREAIMLAVAAQNRCRYCQLAHGVFGRAAGLEEHEIQAILDDQALADWPEGERLALVYVRDLARRGFASRDEALRQRLGQHFERATVETIEATARLMNLANRFGNTFDALLARLARRCDRSGAGWADHAVTTPLFLLGAAMASPLVGLTAALTRLGRRR